MLQNLSTMARILIVDDSRLTRMLLGTLLGQLAPDCEIAEASSADAALELATSQRFDLISLDMNMPGRDGLTLAPELKASNPACHIVLLTANIQDAVRQRASELGLHFLAKPIDESKARAMLQLLAGS